MNRSVPINSASLGEFKWFFTSANPTAAGMPAARKAAVSKIALGTQKFDALPAIRLAR